MAKLADCKVTFRVRRRGVSIMASPIQKVSALVTHHLPMSTTEAMNIINSLAPGYLAKMQKGLVHDISVLRAIQLVGL